MISRDNVSTWQVLVIDDEPDSLEVMVRVLKHYGATVLTAPNGEAALEIMRSRKPTFILTDLSMPVMDGWQLLHHLQNDPDLAQIPLIALTAHAMKGDREEALRAGFRYYLNKPLSPLTLIDDLVRLFEE